MNEQTLALLRELSAKLGTTTEFLWGVLIKQAKISGIAQLLAFIAMLIGLILFVAIRLFCARKNDDKFTDELIENIGPWMIWLVFFCGTFVFILSQGSEILSCFYNPEYWALKQILGR